jgi:hypothetical protein
MPGRNDVKKHDWGKEAAAMVFDGSEESHYHPTPDNFQRCMAMRGIAQTVMRRTHG